MSNGHTPGPWVVVTELRDTDEIICDMLNNGYVAITQGQKLSNWRDDAALIAAAPDLLAALEAVDREHDLLLAMKSCIASRPQGVISIAVDDDEDAIAWRGYRDEAQKLVDARRAALAKARGTPC